MHASTVTKIEKLLKKYWNLVHETPQSFGYRGNVWGMRTQIARAVMGPRDSHYRRINMIDFSMVMYQDDTLEMVSAHRISMLEKDDVQAIWDLENFVAWVLDSAELINQRDRVFDVIQDCTVGVVSGSNVLEDEDDIPILQQHISDSEKPAVVEEEVLSMRQILAQEIDPTLEIDLRVIKGVLHASVERSEVSKRRLSPDERVEWRVRHTNDVRYNTTANVLQSAGAMFSHSFVGCYAGRLVVQCRPVSQAEWSPEESYIVEYDENIQIRCGQSKNGDQMEFWLEGTLPGGMITEEDADRIEVRWEFSADHHFSSIRSNITAMGLMTVAVRDAVFFNTLDRVFVRPVFSHPAFQKAIRPMELPVMQKWSDEADDELILLAEDARFGFLNPLKKVQQLRDFGGKLKPIDLTGKVYRNKQSRKFVVERIINPPNITEFESGALREYTKDNCVVVTRDRQDKTKLIFLVELLADYTEVQVEPVAEETATEE